MGETREPLPSAALISPSAETLWCLAQWHSLIVDILNVSVLCQRLKHLIVFCCKKAPIKISETSKLSLLLHFVSADYVLVSCAIAKRPYTVPDLYSFRNTFLQKLERTPAESSCT